MNLRSKQRGDAGIELIVTLVLFLIIGLCTLIYNAYKCDSRATLMGLTSDYGPVQGCMVKVGTRWAPLEYIRIVDDKVIIQGDGEG